MNYKIDYIFAIPANKCILPFSTSGTGYTTKGLYIGIHNPLATPGITDFRYIFDNSPVTYHNVKDMISLRAIDQCMFVATQGSPGNWVDAPCQEKKAAMCEANKVILMGAEYI